MSIMEPRWTENDGLIALVLFCLVMACAVIATVLLSLDLVEVCFGDDGAVGKDVRGRDAKKN